MTTWLEKAKTLDENDPLKHLRERFNIPLARNTCDISKIEDDRKCIYLNGNSLGCMVSIVLSIDLLMLMTIERCC